MFEEVKGLEVNIDPASSLVCIFCDGIATNPRDVNTCLFCDTSDSCRCCDAFDFMNAD